MTRDANELQRDSATEYASAGKSSLQKFPTRKLSATRYYGHAVGIAELYEGYFFHPQASCIFQARPPREIAIFKVLQNLVMGDGYKVRSLISDIDPSEVGK